MSRLAATFKRIIERTRVVQRVQQTSAPQPGKHLVTVGRAEMGVFPGVKLATGDEMMDGPLFHPYLAGNYRQGKIAQEGLENAVSHLVCHLLSENERTGSGQRGLATRDRWARSFLTHLSRSVRARRQQFCAAWLPARSNRRNSYPHAPPANSYHRHRTPLNGLG